MKIMFNSCRSIFTQNSQKFNVNEYKGVNVFLCKHTFYSDLIVSRQLHMNAA